MTEQAEVKVVNRKITVTLRATLTEKCTLEWAAETEHPDKFNVLLDTIIGELRDMMAKEPLSARAIQQIKIDYPDQGSEQEEEVHYHFVKYAKNESAWRLPLIIMRKKGTAAAPSEHLPKRQITRWE